MHGRWIRAARGAAVTARRAPLAKPAAPRAFATLTADRLPRHILECEYAVRGAVLLKAEEIEARLLAGDTNLAFDQVVACNIGNPQAVGAAPLTFHRQVLSCLTHPDLLNMPGVFPDDVRERALHYLKGIKDGRAGAYSHSKGHKVFRDQVADFLTERDGIETNPDDIFMTDGASAAVAMVLKLCVRGPSDGVMLPIPQYPLYSATMTLLGGQSVGYFLEEENNWSISLKELEASITKFRKEGGEPRALVVINPGNPTGQVLSREAMVQVLEFAEREKLLLLADEVYQDNIHADGKDFISFRRLASELGIGTEVFSFHSASKGVTGECGLRGGFVHCHNVSPCVMEQMYKISSINLCSNVLGQALMASIVSLPHLTSSSRALFDQERHDTRLALKRKAVMVTEKLNEMEGISCQPIEGAMYAFPSVDIKGYIMKKAMSSSVAADQVYCMEMVERTGVITVPGSGFGQRPGTFHFRMTILPEESTLQKVLKDIGNFHAQHADGW
jgi:alanine transaminase